MQAKQDLYTGRFHAHEYISLTECEANGGQTGLIQVGFMHVRTSTSENARPEEAEQGVTDRIHSH
jgi:hypothetical protein